MLIILELYSQQNKVLTQLQTKNRNASGDMALEDTNLNLMVQICFMFYINFANIIIIFGANSIYTASSQWNFGP